MTEAREFLAATSRALIEKSSAIVIGVSGGPDSVFLLRQCLILCSSRASTQRLVLIVAHVDHGLRGRASKKEAAFVEKLAQKNGLIFELLTLDLRHSRGNLEETGRKKRYEFFEKIRQKYQADWILTAHHRDDAVETALFNFIRGASYSGLRGINEVDFSRHLLRPLLTVSKKEIISWLRHHRHLFHHDRSNDDIRYSRNFLRHRVIPLLQKINPNFEQTLTENLKNFNEIADFLDHQSQHWLDQNLKNDAFSLRSFLEQPIFFQKNILSFLYRQRYGSSVKLNQRHLNNLIEILHQQKSNRHKEFGADFLLKITRRSLNEPSPSPQKNDDRVVTFELKKKQKHLQ